MSEVTPLTAESRKGFLLIFSLTSYIFAVGMNGWAFMRWLDIFVIKLKIRLGQAKE
jgi:hypothetical protein